MQGFQVLRRLPAATPAITKPHDVAALVAGERQIRAQPFGAHLSLGRRLDRAAGVPARAGLTQAQALEPDGDRRLRAVVANAGELFGKLRLLSASMENGRLQGLHGVRGSGHRREPGGIGSIIYIFFLLSRRKSKPFARLVMMSRMNAGRPRTDATDFSIRLNALLEEVEAFNHRLGVDTVHGLSLEALEALCSWLRNCVDDQQCAADWRHSPPAR